MLPVGGIERLLVAAVATAYVCPEITTQRPALFGLTSAPLDFVRRREERTLRDTRSDRDAMPVAFYHEEGAAWPRGELPAEVASLFVLKAFACVGVGAIILFVLYALRYGFATAWAKLRACCTRGGSLEMARRKEFAPINDAPSSSDTKHPINVAA